MVCLFHLPMFLHPRRHFTDVFSHATEPFYLDTCWKTIWVVMGSPHPTDPSHKVCWVHIHQPSCHSQSLELENAEIYMLMQYSLNICSINIHQQIYFLKYRIMYRLLWIIFFYHKWGNLSENHCQIKSDKIMLFTVTHTSFSISYTLFNVQNTHWKQSEITHFPIVAKDSLFWLEHYDITTICDVMHTGSYGIVTSYLSIALTCPN